MGTLSGKCLFFPKGVLLGQGDRENHRKGGLSGQNSHSSQGNPGLEFFREKILQSDLIAAPRTSFINRVTV